MKNAIQLLFLAFSYAFLTYKNQCNISYFFYSENTEGYGYWTDFCLNIHEASMAMTFSRE